jgi:carboxyl-terminal processing protease
MNSVSDEMPSSRPKRALRPAYLILFCLVAGMGVGVVYDRLALMTFVPADATSDFRLMSEAWNLIQRHYVDRAAIKPRNLTYGAIGGMVAALGDTGHSTFLPPEVVKRLGVMETGQFKGVGITVEMRNGRVVVISPLDNSPAQRAGVHGGDIILGVDGKDIAGLSLNQVVDRITGPAGTAVELSMLNPRTHQIRKIKMTRETIHVKNVTWQELPGTPVADLRIASFDIGVAKDLRAALRAIQQKKLKGMVLDLRNNPGGVLDEAIAVASQFLSHGNVLLVKDASGKQTPEPVKPGGLATGLPLVILVNDGSASASEIVAGALRDARRAPLVGETTFGTGTVLNEFPLPDGSALMLAVQEWLTPSGHSFWHRGIQPDFPVSLPDNGTLLVPEAERAMTAAQLQSSGDTQLLKALQIVSQEIQGRPIPWPANAPATNAASATDQ